MSKNKYVLITAARNEAEFIEQTIKSVIQQTRLPLKWVIVNDNSTDNTSEIVKKYVDLYPFIFLLEKKDGHRKDFASKVFALHSGYNALKSLEYEYIGILDADITFQTDYYQCIINKFEHDSKLGIAGGVRVDITNGKEVHYRKMLDSVCGAVHFFCKSCYDDIGGYVPLAKGSEDGYAEIMARKKGWKVQSFPEIKILHHRITGSAEQSLLKHHFNIGKRHYHLGYHPLYFLAVSTYRMLDKPFIIGGLARIIGFFITTLKQEKREISQEFIRFLRNEQLCRLRLKRHITG